MRQLLKDAEEEGITHLVVGSDFGGRITPPTKEKMYYSVDCSISHQVFADLQGNLANGSDIMNSSKAFLVVFIKEEDLPYLNPLALNQSSKDKRSELIENLPK